jgi:hypothetical protein
MTLRRISYIIKHEENDSDHNYLLMNKLIKFGYYNISLGIGIWLILFLYKINIWLAVIGSIFVIYVFIIITSKVLIYINNI